MNLIIVFGFGIGFGVCIGVMMTGFYLYVQEYRGVIFMKVSIPRLKSGALQQQKRVEKYG